MSMAKHDASSSIDAVENAIDGEVQNAMETVSDFIHVDNEGGFKSSLAALLRRIPKKAWFLMGLGVAGIIVTNGNIGNVKGHRKVLNIGSRITNLFAKGGNRLRKNRHPSICHYVQLKPDVYHFEDALYKRKFCAQDSFDVEKKITGFGSPDWENSHEPAIKTAPVLVKLRKAGATCIGKTIMDEMGFCLLGANRWLGTPENPFSTSRICGGSSSGAAVSVGSKVVDFAIGIDTVGDVRVPAACCGVLGFRSSHGAISLEGTIPVASSFDAVGWFARNAGLLRLVGRQLCPHVVMDGKGPKRFYMAHDVFKLSAVSHLRTADVLARSVQRTVGRHTLCNLNFIEYLEDHAPAIQTFKKELERMGLDSSQYTALDVLRESMLLFQRHEFKGNHGEWIAKAKPYLTRTVESRVHKAVLLPDSEALRVIAIQNDAILVVPALPSLPPKSAAVSNELETFEYKTQALMSLSSLSRCCQVMASRIVFKAVRETEVVIPVGRNELPISVSLLARNGADLLLLETVMLLHTTIQQEVLKKPIWNFCTNTEHTSVFKCKKEPSWKVCHTRSFLGSP
ncbi:amidase 1 isoform X4 [Physcomitrium patens]|uniref:amidase 1 isoform X4 n=1 Tax=Physcomitrium patens TaxID=3218 RepID=UPI003CCDC993